MAGGGASGERGERRGGQLGVRVGPLSDFGKAKLPKLWKGGSAMHCHPSMQNSGDDAAAVDADGLAGDVLAALVAEPGAGVGDIVGLAHAADRDGL